VITCLMQHSEAWTVGGIAKVGVYFSRLTSTGGSASLSGYDTKVEARLHQLEDGGVFIDKRLVPESVLVDGVCNGPMLDLALPPQKVEPFAHDDNLAMMLPGLGDGFRTLAALRLSDRKWRGFDSMGLDVHVAFWAERGALIGVRRGDEMHWSDGRVEPIQPCRCWVKTCRRCNKMRYYVDRIHRGGIPEGRVPEGPDDHCPECKKALAQAASELGVGA